MNGFCIEQIRRSFDGIVASVLATCDDDGQPNVSMISQVYYVDSRHVALSYQFFNKTRRNVLATRRASVLVIDPVTGHNHRMDLEYVETQTQGPIFEQMRAQLAGIASHHGMDGVFRLLGADIFRVVAIEPVEGTTGNPEPEERPVLALTRRCFAELDACGDLEELIDCATECVERHFGIHHSILLLTESGGSTLYAVGSRGYAASGAGAEIALGEGVIGVAAREATPIRIGYFTREYSYGAAISGAALRAGILTEAGRCIPLPGLARPQSQIALPILGEGRVQGVLFAESETPMAFGHAEEDALSLVASHFGARMCALRQAVVDDAQDEATPPPTATRKVVLRFVRFDQSVFLDNDYLIKGVAGAILWRLLQIHRETGRSEFSLRELRVDPELRLPTLSENLDARLILLRRRLLERGGGIQIQKSGRGRVRLDLECLLSFEETD